MNDIPVFNIGKPAEIDRLIAACATYGLVGRVELLRAVRRGEIALVEPVRDAVVPLRVLERSTRPQIAIIGDDDYCSTGPTDWPATRRLFHWAKAAMVHASGADVPSYRLAIDMALLAQRFLLVETGTAHMQEWGEALLARKIPFVCLKPTDGVHPRPIERRAMQ
jgi:hypothetical protein